MLLSSLTIFGQNTGYIGYSKTYRKTLLRDNPYISGSKVIARIPGNKEIKVLEYAGNVAGNVYFKIEYKGKVGFVDDKTISTSVKMSKARDAKKNKEEEFARRSYLEGKYEIYVANRIYNKSVWIGMTKRMAIDSWGVPSDTNKSIGEWGTHEQWVYRPKDPATKILLDAGMDISDIYVPDRFKKSKYLYFENGKLTSIQR